MGIATVSAGEVDAGVALLEEAIELSRRSEAPREAATASTELAWVLLGREELDRARELLESAHATFVDLADRAKTADCLEGFAGIAFAEQDPEEAARLLGRAASLRESVGGVRQPDQDRFVRQTLASVAEALGPDVFEQTFQAGRAITKANASH